ncbi:MAG: potassium channel family protein, partial [Paraburkholderia sp.]|uniref:potassium channel family protein n=1 Tax=Paraburkholderia sp. TaxID=1926495 RepID=UPI003C34097E
LIYFSLTTLSTIGFGDITPVTLQARYVAVAEGITGQFYLAILVARLVGMQMTQSPTQHAEQAGLESGTEKK